MAACVAFLVSSSSFSFKLGLAGADFRLFFLLVSFSSVVSGSSFSSLVSLLFRLRLLVDLLALLLFNLGAGCFFVVDDLRAISSSLDSGLDEEPFETVRVRFFKLAAALELALAFGFVLDEQ